VGGAYVGLVGWRGLNHGFVGSSPYKGGWSALYRQLDQRSSERKIRRRIGNIYRHPRL
jgi:hypothetical protein